MSARAAAVLPAVTLEQVLEELADAAEYAAAAGLELDATTVTEERPVFYVKFPTRAGLTFHVEFNCREYPLHPPTIEFVDATRTRRGTKDLYPAGFHDMPCVCARYNRKAYSQHGGPHNDWRMEKDWQLPTSNGPAIDTLAMIVSDLHSKIWVAPGRMG